MVRAGRKAVRSQPEMYAEFCNKSMEFAALTHEIRNILRLLGGSRQDFAFRCAVAAVLPGRCPAAPTIPAHELPLAAGGGIAGIKKSRVQVRPFLPVALEPGKTRNGKKLGVSSPG